MHQSAEETQLHGILSNEQLARDTFTSLALCKRKALGDVHPFSFVLESVSLQNKGRLDSCHFLWVHHSMGISGISSDWKVPSNIKG